MIFRSRFFGQLAEAWALAGYAMLFTLGVVGVMVISAALVLMLSWYLIPVVFVMIFVTLMWVERGNDE